MEEVDNMKLEWRKHEKEIYNIKKVPTLLDVCTQNFIMIDGKGNPNDEEFSEKVSALFSLAYAIKMDYKKSHQVKDIDTYEITDYVVYPLEGIWKVSKDNSTKNNCCNEFDKNNLEYTIMIRQPDFIAEDDFKSAADKVAKKKPNVFYKDIYFDSMNDGDSVNILHVGSYDGENSSFEKMDLFCKKNGLTRKYDWHREIYLNNSNRTEESKLKTILRYCIK